MAGKPYNERDAVIAKENRDKSGDHGEDGDSIYLVLTTCQALSSY